MGPIKKTSWEEGPGASLRSFLNSFHVGRKNGQRWVGWDRQKMRSDRHRSVREDNHGVNRRKTNLERVADSIIWAFDVRCIPHDILVILIEQFHCGPTTRVGLNLGSRKRRSEVSSDMLARLRPTSVDGYHR
jgi:hypothetical protein